MTAQDKLRELARLFREAGVAHHHAYLATDGDDPDWPQWYAIYLRSKLRALLGVSFTVEELARVLKALEAERKRRQPDADWPTFYAEYLLSRDAELVA